MRFLICLMVCIFSIMTANATGPSSITATIEPIAINPDGDILCKAQYSENQMGSDSFLPIEFSLCLVKDKKIVILEKTTFDYYLNTDSSAYEQYQKSLEQFQKMGFSKDSFLVNKHYDDLIVQGFKVINLEDYKVAPSFSLASFKVQFGKDFLSLPQTVLYKKPIFISKNDFLVKDNLEIITLNPLLIAYKINHQLWLLQSSNTAVFEDESIEDNYTFWKDYYTFTFEGFLPNHPKKQEIGYDLQSVNSIIFLD